MGNALVRGISGGEKKRLNIATELVTDPSLVFLDEPTTGLDSFSAQSIMQTLLKMAQNARTVIATIHQPRSSIYQMFDMLMLLSEGRTMYFGHAAEAVSYFEHLGYFCPPEFNPSDFFLDFLSLDQRSPNLEKTSRERIKCLGDAFAARQVQDREQEVSMAMTAGSDSPAPTSLASLEKKESDAANSGSEAMDSSLWRRKYATSWLYQFTKLTKRTYRSL